MEYLLDREMNGQASIKPTVEYTQKILKLFITILDNKVTDISLDENKISQEVLLSESMYSALICGGKSALIGYNRKIIELLEHNEILIPNINNNEQAAA